MYDLWWIALAGSTMWPEADHSTRFIVRKPSTVVLLEKFSTRNSYSEAHNPPTIQWFAGHLLDVKPLLVISVHLFQFGDCVIIL